LICSWSGARQSGKAELSGRARSNPAVETNLLTATDALAISRLEGAAIHRHPAGIAHVPRMESVARQYESMLARERGDPGQSA
jgi:hypothetical protein